LFLIGIIVFLLHEIAGSMILDLKIQNFLSFKQETTFSFEATADKTLEDYYVAVQEDGTRILKLGMVYGANASGKSNLVEAFRFVSKFVHRVPPEGRNAETDFVPFSFGKTSDEPGVFELTFYVEGKKHRYSLVVDEEKVLDERLVFYPGAQPATVFCRTFDAEKNISIIEFGSKIKVSEQAREAIQLKTLKNTSVIAGYNQVNISVEEMERVNKWFLVQYLDSIDPYMDLTDFTDEGVKKNPEIKKHTLEFLKEADFNIADVIFEKKIRDIPKSFLKVIDKAPLAPEEIARLKKEKVFHVEETLFSHKIEDGGEVLYYSLPEERQSKGTLRYYGLAGPFYHAVKQDAFLPIDEIGSALHPLLVIHFIKEFLKKSNRAQLLFTTHNMTILNEKDILRKDAIWFTEKLKDGSTDLFSLADFNFRKELSFYNAYKIGKFGGIPEL
jgi:AAA15 family ATPase/GTPase